MKVLATKKIGVWILALSLFAAHLFFRSVAHADGGASWVAMYTKGGECEISFPMAPQLVQQALNLPGGKKLIYDMYLAPFENKGIFLLLVATYPEPLAPGYEVAGVEGLLRGILNHHPDNRLVFSNVVEVDGKTSIDFLIQSGSNYFRGQAMMVGNKLFLLAMEGKKESREESVFSRFAKSFHLK